MDKLLHCGAYAIQGEHEVREKRKKMPFLRLLGVDDEYTRFDTFLAVFLFGWTMSWFVIFVIGTVYALNREVTEDQWAAWWLFNTGLGLVIGSVTVVWFLGGGFRDLKDMFRTLATAQTDVTDDGFVAEDDLPDARPPDTMT